MSYFSYFYNDFLCNGMCSFTGGRRCITFVRKGGARRGTNEKDPNILAFV